MKTSNPDPSLELACRIYAYREDGESWTDAVDAFARTILMRHPRTVMRWLSGESPIPKAVAAWIMDGCLQPSEQTPPSCDRCGSSMTLDFNEEMWICGNPMCGLVP